jgi:hypothetical protein
MAKPVALIEQGEIKGLAGTTDGDYLRWNGTANAWESQAGSGGGGVSSVGATAPLASSGGSNPTISLTAGSNAQVLISNGTAYSSQTVSGDATITNTGAVTVTGLQGNDVSASTPANGQTLVWSSGSNTWIPGASAASGSGGGGVTLYLNQANAAGSPTTNLPANTKQLGLTAVASQSSIAKTNISTASWDLVADFVTDSTEAYTSIPAGIWDFNVYVNSTAQIGSQSYFRISVYAYDGSTDPLAGTLLAQSDNIYMYDANVITQYAASVLFSAETFSPAKRIFVRLEVRAQQTNHDATFYFGDATATHTHTTLPSVTGTGLVKVVNGVFQSPASTLVNVDVAANAAIDVSKLANGSSGQILVAGASSLAYQTMSGDATMASTGALTLANSGVSANTYGSASSVPVTTVDAKGRVTGVTDTSIAISASQVTSGTLDVARGGTGASTLTNHGILVGQGTSAVSTVGPLTNGQLVIGSTGGDPVAASLTGTANQITVTNGVGQITLSTPQDIATTSSPTFAGASIATTGSGTTTIGNTTDGGVVNILGGAGNAMTIGSIGGTTIGQTLSSTTVRGSSITLTPTSSITTSGTLNLNTTSSGTVSISNVANGGNVNIRTSVTNTLTLSPGALTASLGAQATAATAGGAISMTAGTGNTTGAGGAFNVTGGTGGVTGAGGAVAVLGGTGGGTSGTGGAVTLTGGSAGASGSAGGDVTVQAGAGNGAASGTLKLFGGAGSAAVDNGTGSVSILGGVNSTIANRSGDVTVQGGYDATGATNVLPGRVNIYGGDTSASANAKTAGSLVLRGGNNTATGTTGSNGGAISVTGGSGRLGGSITIRHGQNTATPASGTNSCVLIAGATSGPWQGQGAVQIQGGALSAGAVVSVGIANTDIVYVGQNGSIGGGTYTGIPTVVGGFLCLAPYDQTVTAGADLQPLSSYLRISSAGALTAGANISATVPDGAIVLIRNVGSFSITIPSTGNIRTLTNGSKVLAVGGTLTVQYDAAIGAWYEVATVLNAS